MQRAISVEIECALFVCSLDKDPQRKKISRFFVQRIKIGMKKNLARYLSSRFWLLEIVAKFLKLYLVYYDFLI